MNFRFFSAALLLGCLFHTSKGQGQIDMAHFETPVYKDGVGLGDYAADRVGETATLGIFLRGTSTPLATVTFGRGELAPYAIPSLETVTVPGYPAGSSAPLTVKIWIGPSYDFYWVRQSWDFVSLPLGGTRPNSNLPPNPAPDISNFSGGFAPMFPLSPGFPIPNPDLMTLVASRDSLIPIATLMNNDERTDDPRGPSVFRAASQFSGNGATTEVVGDKVFFRPLSALPDFFYYSLSNKFYGTVSTARVDMVQLNIEPLKDQVRLSFQGITNHPYFLEARNAIEEGWTNLPPLAEESPGFYKIIDTNAPQFRYYRVNMGN